MDPKQSSPLDPKLQEAYDKVMGFSPTNDTTGTPPAQPTPAPVDGSVATAPVASTPADATAPSAQPQPTPTDSTLSSNPFPSTDDSSPAPVMPEQPQTPVPSQPATPEIPTVASTPQPMPVESSAPTAVENTVKVSVHGFNATDTKKKGGISPMLIIVAGTALLIAYALFWVKFFNFPLPFLSQ